MSTDAIAAFRGGLKTQIRELHDAIRTLVEPIDGTRFWQRPIEPGNSLGHLVLHLTGNLRHFAGARLAGTGYVRDREREFTETQVPSRAEAMAGLSDAVELFCRIVDELPAERFAEPHPDAVMGTVANALVRLVAHFALHRGQMSYIARMVQP